MARKPLPKRYADHQGAAAKFAAEQLRFDARLAWLDDKPARCRELSRWAAVLEKRAAKAPAEVEHPDSEVSHFA